MESLSPQNIEYSSADHEEFVTNRTNSLLERTKRVLGTGLIVAGSILALTAIGDFMTGGEVSRFLAGISSDKAPEIISWAAQQLAQIPLILKAAGGSALIATGGYLEK